MSRLDQLLEFHAQDPQDSFIRFALASEYVKLGDFPVAQRYFEDLRDLDPKYVGLYFHLGKLLVSMGKVEDALGVYRDGIAIAEQIADHHARSELQSALLEAEMDDYL